MARTRVMRTQFNSLLSLYFENEYEQTEIQCTQIA